MRDLKRRHSKKPTKKVLSNINVPNPIYTRAITSIGIGMIGVFLSDILLNNIFFTFCTARDRISNWQSIVDYHLLVGLTLKTSETRTYWNVKIMSESLCQNFICLKLDIIVVCNRQNFTLHTINNNRNAYECLQNYRFCHCHIPMMCTY